MNACTPTRFTALLWLRYTEHFSEPPTLSPNTPSYRACLFAESRVTELIQPGISNIDGNITTTVLFH